MNISVLYSLDAAAATVCLFSSFLLFARSEGIRARKVLGGTLLAWGMVYLAGFIRMGEIGEMSERGFMPAFGLITGVIGGCSLMFYVLEVMRSGWLTWKRVLLILSPYFLSIAIFAGVLILGNMPIRHLEDPADFVRHFGEFNVWYRLVFLFITIVYVFAMYAVFLRYAPRYRQWTDENFSSTELMDISWFRYLLIGITALSGIYFFAMANETILPLYFHFTAIILFFPYLAFKGLFLQNPYPERFFKDSLQEEEIIVREESNTESNTNNDQVFLAKMEEYRKVFEHWMDTEKPYLRTDFKLADVQARFPMNRTYLSRFFNEFYGCSFSHVVRRYRAEEAMRLIRQNPGLISKELYPLCGFTSEVVFHRAFTEATGMTPKQFRSSINDH